MERKGFKLPLCDTPSGTSYKYNDKFGILTNYFLLEIGMTLAKKKEYFKYLVIQELFQKNCVQP